jgi:Domain of unknown function (DUF1992)
MNFDWCRKVPFACEYSLAKLDSGHDSSRRDGGAVLQDWHESLIDRKIREAQERGEFDNLPGAGQPLPDLDRPYDENWWLKDLLRREDLSYPLPATLALRKEIDELGGKLAATRREATVREIVAELNGRIEQARRGPVDGPAVVLTPLDVESVVRAWRERRAAGPSV